MLRQWLRRSRPQWLGVAFRSTFSVFAPLFRAMKVSGPDQVSVSDSVHNLVAQFIQKNTPAEILAADTAPSEPPAKPERKKHRQPWQGVGAEGSAESKRAQVDRKTRAQRIIANEHRQAPQERPSKNKGRPVQKKRRRQAQESSSESADEADGKSSAAFR